MNPKLAIISLLALGNLAVATELPPLHHAAALGDLSLTKELVQKGASIFTLDAEMGTSVLHKAAVSNNPKLITYLIELGAFINLQAPTNNLTPLHDAVLNRKIKNVKTLLEAGAKTNLKSVWGPTAFEFAKSLAIPEMLKLFEDHFKETQVPQQVELLHQAVQDNNVESVQRLISSGISVEARNRDGNTPLIEAARAENLEVAKRLLELGADANATGLTMRANSGHKAAYRGNTEMIRLLVEKGNLNLDAQGPYNGYSVLHDTLWHGYGEAALMSLKAGANPHLRTLTGLSALDLARIHNLTDVINFIEKK